MAATPRRPRPDYDPATDGNRFAWILRTAAERRAEITASHAQAELLRRDIARQARQKAILDEQEQAQA